MFAVPVKNTVKDGPEIFAADKKACQLIMCGQKLVNSDLFNKRETLYSQCLICSLLDKSDTEFGK